MKPTHQLKMWPHTDVRAWRFERRSARPLWVFRNFHELGAGSLTHRSGEKAHEGNWIVAVDGVALVLTHDEFQLCFREIQNDERGTNDGQRTNQHALGGR
jgi:hypothetical protein